jgi:hypothetical protein
MTRPMPKLLAALERELGISYRQIDYWQRAGAFPTIPLVGSGYSKPWDRLTVDEVVAACVSASFRRLTTDRTKESFRHTMERFMTDGYLRDGIVIFTADRVAVARVQAALKDNAA